MTIWENYLDKLLAHLVREGELTVTYANGETRQYGPGGRFSSKVTIHSDGFARRVIVNPELALGEGYMDGDISLENDDLRAFLALLSFNLTEQGYPWFQKPYELAQNGLKRVHQFNPMSKSARNVEHHYDLSRALYDLFLDEDRQYSCAYFAHPDMTLEEAQSAKKHHIAKKLRVKPGMRVLDIGCGWGGMALTLAKDYGAHVVGVTLSQEQCALARERVAAAGLEDRIDIRLMDYRHVSEHFDRIVSVGMFEHVGLPHYREYFGKVKSLLKPEGVALIHTIGRANRPGSTSTWIQKYIFPGGYTPALSEVTPAIEKENLILSDLEVLRLHYAETLWHWHERFMDRIDEAEALYDARFTRMWRFYLLASEYSFRYGKQVVFQFQLTHDVNDVPITRDYMYAADERPEERTLKAIQ